jgi:hypothetical protein
MRVAHFGPTFWAALGAAAVLAASGVARADGGPKFSSGWWLPVGVSLGGAFRGDDLSDGFFLGGELSSAYLYWTDGPSGLWVGGMVDGVYDFGVKAFRHRIGPEIGWWFLGTEVAYVGEVRGGEYRPGISVRASGNLLGILTLYGGFGRTWGSDGGASYGEFGGLLKFPIPLTADDHPYRPDLEPAPQPPYDPGGPLQPLPPGTPPPAPGQPPSQPSVPGQPPGQPQGPGVPPSQPYVQVPPSPYATPPPPPPPR